jgi:hypothetical protein
MGISNCHAFQQTHLRTVICPTSAVRKIPPGPPCATQHQHARSRAQSPLRSSMSSSFAGRKRSGEHGGLQPRAGLHQNGLSEGSSALTTEPCETSFCRSPGLGSALGARFQRVEPGEQGCLGQRLNQSETRIPGLGVMGDGVVWCVVSRPLSANREIPTNSRPLPRRIFPFLFWPARASSARLPAGQPAAGT